MKIKVGKNKKYCPSTGDILFSDGKMYVFCEQYYNLNKDASNKFCWKKLFTNKGISADEICMSKYLKESFDRGVKSLLCGEELVVGENYFPYEYSELTIYLLK